MRLDTVKEVRCGITSWKERIKKGDIFRDVERRHLQVQKVILINSSHVVLESVAFEDRVLTGDEAVCGPTYLRRGVGKIYHPIDDIKQKFSLVEKDQKLLLLPLREKLCF